jgi:hypothetical protein
MARRDSIYPLSLLLRLSGPKSDCPCVYSVPLFLFARFIFMMYSYNPMDIKRAEQRRAAPLIAGRVYLSRDTLLAKEEHLQLINFTIRIFGIATINLRIRRLPTRRKRL